MGIVHFKTPAPEDHHWSYHAVCGPHAWAKYYPAAAGIRQSPINIDTKTVQYDEKLRALPLKFVHTRFGPSSIHNMGHGFRVECDTDLEVTGGPLPAHYQFAQFHLHWGTTDEWGAEHLMNGHSFAGELHVVFWNKSKYHDFKTAVASEKDGSAVAVFGVHVEIGEENALLKPIIDHLEDIAKEGSTLKNMPQIDLDHLLPDNKADYYTYPGSITTPPCTEIVIWTIFKDPITMSSQQLAVCRNMAKTETGNYEDMFRPCCPLGNRVVRASFKN